MLVFICAIARFNPGPYAISRRLVSVSWWDALSCSKKRISNCLNNFKKVVVGNSQSGEEHPTTMPDGNEFYGLYPAVREVPPPKRPFSADGTTYYMSLVQLGDVRLAAVDLGTGQVTFSPYRGGVTLLDVHEDVVLVLIDPDGHDYISRPAVGIGRLHNDYW